MKCEKKNRTTGKGLVEPCVICGENRVSHKSHFPKRKRKGEEGKATIPLCPTHHNLLDTGRLSKYEYNKIRKARYTNKSNTAEEFVRWAYEKCYPYNVEDLKKKFWNYSPLKHK